MKRVLLAYGLTVMGAGLSVAQVQAALDISSLCDLQSSTPQGTRRVVRVRGLYSAGAERQQIADDVCSSKTTAVEFALTSHRLWKELVRVSNAFEHSLVVFEGEFYGPPVPDPKLPAEILKQYHPGWDYDSQTKIVVHSILNVRPARRKILRPHRRAANDDGRYCGSSAVRMA